MSRTHLHILGVGHGQGHGAWHRVAKKVPLNVIRRVKEKHLVHTDLGVCVCVGGGC